MSTDKNHESDVEHKSLGDLKTLLKTLFQLDSPELDFGIYRIINFERKEVEDFIDKDLPATVGKEFERFRTQSLLNLQQDLEAKKKEIQSLEEKIGEKILKNGDIDEKFVEKPFAKEYLEIRKKLEEAEKTYSIENQVFNDLFTFFARYYEDGDFISKRRYSSRQHRYAIPYDGEEVKFYWANFDQYYMKSEEVLKNYELNHGGWKIAFKTISAEPKGASQTEERKYFILRSEKPIETNAQEKTCVISFEYKALDANDLKHLRTKTKTGESKSSSIKQEDLNPIISASILKQTSNDYLKSILMTKQGEKSLLEKHLFRYAREVTSDFFIHKNLKDFLEGELDYFIKTEVLTLPSLDQLHVTRANVVEAIGRRIIEFLSQIEDFQKRLWDKRKFVIDTGYVITLDLIPQQFHKEILANKSQLKEWKELGFGDPKKEIQNRLPVDTKHFPAEFNEKLLEKLTEDRSLDDLIDGILIKSDNFHALNLLQSGWNKRVHCVYIDPPFNTAASEILYKNNYKHSSWLSMIYDRIEKSVDLMVDNAIICVAIDDAEVQALSYCMSLLFERELAVVVVRSNPHGRAMSSGFSRTQHEYALFYGNTNKALIGRLPRTEEKQARYQKSNESELFTPINLRKTGAGASRAERPKMFYPIYVQKKGNASMNTEIRIPSLEWSESSRKWKVLEPPSSNEVEVWPIDEAKAERVWNLGCKRARMEIQAKNIFAKFDGAWQIYRNYFPNQEGAIPGTWWGDAKYSTTDSGTKTLKDMFGARETFSYPKSTDLVEDCLRASKCSTESWVLDFFAGSGTTAQAVINLNREDEGRRKYILIETADYFDSVIIPRIKKTVFAESWKDGKPIINEESNSISHFFKYQHLEQYEDTLHNIEFLKKDKGLKITEYLGNSSASEEYRIKYHLDYETAGSPSLLALPRFQAPFEYELRVISNSTGEEKIHVDLVETFNYIVGLSVEKFRFFESGGRKYVFVFGRNPHGKKIAVVWRPTKDIDLSKDKETVKTVLDKWHPEEIYINADSLVEGYKPIETEFKALLEA